jgi:TRAP-type transport system periplasmic protein
MKKCFGSGFVIIFFAIVFFLTGTPIYGQEKIIRLRYADITPAAHKRSKLTVEWCNEIEKRTNGRVKITHFAGSTLAPPMQVYDSTVRGIADIGQSLMSYSPGRLPLTEVLSLPLGFTSGYQATGLANEYYRKFQPREFGDSKVMFLHASGSCIFMTRKPIQKTEDLKGLRIKVNSENADIAHAVGAAPVTMPVSETYDGLQKGLLDGMLLSVETLKGYKFGEVIKTALENHAFSYSTGLFVIMNKARWDSFPKDIQQIIEKVNEEYVEKYGRLWNEMEKEGKDYGLSKGVNFVQVPREEQAKWAEKMKPILDQYVKEIKAKGLPSEEALRFCQDYLKKNP